MWSNIRPCTIYRAYILWSQPSTSALEIGAYVRQTLTYVWCRDEPTLKGRGSLATPNILKPYDESDLTNSFVTILVVNANNNYFELMLIIDPLIFLTA
jgi:hypothetical protein